jgi:hypothetical protein
MKEEKTLAEQVEELRDSTEDTSAEFYVLNTLLVAIEDGRVDELEAAITPLVEQWLEESLGAEDVLAMWRETVP